MLFKNDGHFETHEIAKELERAATVFRRHFKNGNLDDASVSQLMQPVMLAFSAVAIALGVSREDFGNFAKRVAEKEWDSVRADFLDKRRRPNPYSDM